MPCFKGLAVSIHADGSPIPEYGQSKQSRVSRITNYIPVPKPTLDSDGKPEPAKFAISITLLTPGQAIPYSTPKPTSTEPDPQPLYVNDAAGKTGTGNVAPYMPMTNSSNETIAAYIYFDGRPKEEVATLLRPGEETWVNSRWVQVAAADGGGLAEREFLFKEVGLETWLNGLDLQGSDAAAKLEKRRQKFERRRRREEARASQGTDGDKRKSLLGSRDPDDAIRKLLDDDSSSESDSEDEMPEATGQIKVAMFRVIASGEVKKGEYSPQFDANDDDDTAGGSGQNGGGMDADVEHTTSFAKPKTLDPKTISTQTVTGIDGPEKPYATFTFFYRGERQLQKMGILPSSKTPTATPANTKRRSTQLDFSNLGPLKSTGTVGFSAFRDQTQKTKRRKNKKNGAGDAGSMDEDSDEDEDDEAALLSTMEESDDKDVKPKLLAPEDAKSSGELAEGVDRIKLKRQRSMEPDSGSTSDRNKSPSLGPPTNGTPPDTTSSAPSTSHGGVPSSSAPTGLGIAPSPLSKSLSDDQVVGSPLKKHRASLFGDAFVPPTVRPTPPSLGDVMAKAEAGEKARLEAAADASSETPANNAGMKMEPEEDL